MNHNITRFFEQMKQSRVAFIGTGVTNGDIIRLFRKRALRLLCWIARPQTSWAQPMTSSRRWAYSSVWGMPT